jgi:DNA polymerase-4
MNSFFASCEQANNEEYIRKPIIVAGDPRSRHGIVLAASYEAKKYGIKTTMPIWQALNLCKDAIVVKPKMGLYSEVSDKIMKILDRYTPIKEKFSIDEAFLDMGNEKDVLGVARNIQKTILDEVGIMSSIGISTNKFLAKMASEMKKPMGITTLYIDEIEKKIYNMKVKEMFGVGKKTAKTLNNMGIITIGDLSKVNEDVLSKRIGLKHARKILNNSRGIGEDVLDPNSYSEFKSVGNEITLKEDLDIAEDILVFYKRLSEKVAYRLRDKSYKGKTINLKIKYYDFEVITRSKSIQTKFDDADTIYKEIKELFMKNWDKRKVRLIGVSVSNVESIKEDYQMSLFDNKKGIEEDLDKIRNKYGNGIIRKGI